MIYFKIYCTLLLITLTVILVTWILANFDDERSDLWFKISIISWIILFIMMIVGAIIGIWIWD
jgi:uncharacterized membrane protein